MSTVHTESEHRAGPWRCFFCDELFTHAVDARAHFGTDQGSETACRIKAAGEFALLQALRNAEDALARYRSEDSDVLRAMWSQASDHRQALIREEENGYARGVADGRKYPLSDETSNEQENKNGR